MWNNWQFALGSLGPKMIHVADRNWGTIIFFRHNFHRFLASLCIFSIKKHIFDNLKDVSKKCTSWGFFCRTPGKSQLTLWTWRKPSVQASKERFFFRNGDFSRCDSVKNSDLLWPSMACGRISWLVAGCRNVNVVGFPFRCLRRHDDIDHSGRPWWLVFYMDPALPWCIELAEFRFMSIPFQDMGFLLGVVNLYRMWMEILERFMDV